MTDWLISVPVWGARCVESFLDYGLPSIQAATANLGGHVRFVIHTDHPFAISEALRAFELDRIVQVLNRHDGNKTRAAKELGISREWLSRRLKELQS